MFSSARLVTASMPRWLSTWTMQYEYLALFPNRGFFCDLVDLPLEEYLVLKLSKLVRSKAEIRNFSTSGTDFEKNLGLWD